MIKHKLVHPDQYSEDSKQRRTNNHHSMPNEAYFRNAQNYCHPYEHRDSSNYHDENLHQHPRASPSPHDHLSAYGHRNHQHENRYQPPHNGYSNYNNSRSNPNGRMDKPVIGNSHPPKPFSPPVKGMQQQISHWNLQSTYSQQDPYANHFHLQPQHGLLDISVSSPPARWEDRKRTTEEQRDSGTEQPELSDEDIQKLYDQLEIRVQGTVLTVPRPITRFDCAPFPDWMIKELQRRYAGPSPIQCVGWPVVLAQRDMIGVAKTGSGKTLAYLLPAFIHIINNQQKQRQIPIRKPSGPMSLVLAPTRELAMQIESEAALFMRACPVTVSTIRLTCVFGGVPRGYQATALESGVHLCIATPGRLLDFLDSRTTNLSAVTYLVLDEADRMLDMGFEPQIRRIITQTPSERQTVMWSATWPKEVQKLACDFCRRDCPRISVGSHELQANEAITQLVDVCRENERFGRLLYYLTQHGRNASVTTAPSGGSGRGGSKKILIFCETKRGCDALCDRLRQQQTKFAVESIHGDKEQRERARILEGFRRGRIDTLIATDVVSRGLDIKNIDLVINYDLPKTIEDYIHRVGRTGRAGASGTSITLFSEAINYAEKSRMAKDIATVIRDVGQTPPEKLNALASATTQASDHRYYGSQWGTNNTAARPPSSSRNDNGAGKENPSAQTYGVGVSQRSPHRYDHNSNWSSNYRSHPNTTSTKSQTLYRDSTMRSHQSTVDHVHNNDGNVDSSQHHPFFRNNNYDDNYYNKYNTTGRGRRGRGRPNVLH